MLRQWMDNEGVGQKTQDSRVRCKVYVFGVLGNEFFDAPFLPVSTT